MLKTLTGLLALSTLGVAQGSSFTSPQAQSPGPSGYHCGFKDGNYCFRDNLESPFIVRCVGGRGVLGNCNDKFGAKGSTRNENPCYQPDSRKYNAACSTNKGIVYPENGRRPFLRPDYRPHHPPGLDDSSKDLGVGDSFNRDTTSETQFDSLGQGQGGYGNQGVYGGRPEGEYGGQGQPPFGNGNNNQNNNPNNNQNQNQNQHNDNANNNANSNQNQNTNANQNGKPNNNNGGSLVGGPPIQKDVVKNEVGKRQEDGDESSPENDVSSCPDGMEQGNEGDLIPPNDSGGGSTPGKRMVVNTAKKGSSTRVETKTSGIIVAMAMVIALV